MKKIIFLLIITSACYTLRSQNVITVDPSVKSSKEVMDGFMDMRFGMFIHWGPVTLRGKDMSWTRGNEISKEDYDSLYKEFDPVLFNADDWVKAARDAGR